MEKISKIAGISLIIATLTGCTVPGSYVNNGTINKSANVGGQWTHPRIIPIDANLMLASHEYASNTVIPAPNAKGLPKPGVASKQKYTNRYEVAPGQLFNQKPYDYKVGKYDILQITVWDHPELSTPTMPATGDTALTTSTADTSNAFTANNQLSSSGNGILVSAKGNIFFPYAGDVHVAGMTVNQLHKLIQTRLKKYINNPQVSVRVAAFRSQSVNVIGEVLKPSLVPISDKPLTILNSITLAGGVNPQFADTTHIYVIRGDITHPIIFVLNAQLPDSLLVSEQFNLQANDIVYVPATGGANWNKVLSNILPSIQTIWYTKSITT